ncbi:translation elongation factor Ts [Faecalicatena contorta]|uniref:translation elongation factor Ts n=1 Tax=Faecalicatena contorta TaxID=39482 RepID=UPI001F2A6486|nr:translation elongation factor Ts [Faecalicatena contorta]MCF2683859.1 elongation factor Ts [Faecalicatena contorta]
MAVTAKMVKELREMTGAGMMDCKKALNETDGDMDAAIEYLRKNGEAKAVKKAGRIAAEGIVMADVQGDNTAAIVEVNSETDFVAKNADFQGFVKAVVNQALATENTEMEAFMAEAWNEDASKTVNDALTEKIAVIGEKLSIRRFEKVTIENGTVVSYIHGGGRIGVLVVAETAVVNDAVKEALKNVAMQVAALNAKYISQADIEADYIEHEKEILLAQIMNDPKESQKPEKVIQGMINGRINKEMKEICLLDQVYVKAEDGKQSVAKYLQEVGKANGTEIKLQKFVRYETGEGLEKKNEDFAAEVAAQMAGK